MKVLVDTKELKANNDVNSMIIRKLITGYSIKEIVDELVADGMLKIIAYGIVNTIASKVLNSMKEVQPAA